MTFLEFLEPFSVSLFKKKMVLVYDQTSECEEQAQTEARKSFGRWILIAPAPYATCNLLLSNSKENAII
jgi:hypothetical protein